MKNVYMIKDFDDPLEVYGVIVSDERIADPIKDAINGAKAWMEENDYTGYDIDIVQDFIEHALKGHSYEWAMDYNLYM